MSFRGFPAEAFSFYERLAADNSRTFWQANKADYQTFVRGPMDELLAELDERGPFQVFRPYNDVRFAKGRPPYKEQIGAYGESEGGAGHYVALSATNLLVGSGYYVMATDQLERFRTAVDAEAMGAEVAALCAALVKQGFEIGAIDTLKTAPRGYPKDHPRIELLRRKGLMASKQWPVAPWMHTKAAVKKVRDAWSEVDPLNEWLDLHVGPSVLAPDDAELERAGRRR